jgi:hypothetical protein
VKKIIHLSDLHVGHKECGDRFRFIIESISKACRPSSDFIAVITGDLVDNAFHEEQVEEAAAGIRMLKEKGYGYCDTREPRLRYRDNGKQEVRRMSRKIFWNSRIPTQG